MSRLIQRQWSWRPPPRGRGRTETHGWRRTAQQGRWVGLFGCLVLLSCAELNGTPEAAVQRWVGEVQSRWRTPGDHLLEPPEGLAKAYNCDSQPFPFLLIEANELAPATLEAGHEFNHHLVYFLCPTSRAEVITGTLSRRLYYQGQVVFEDLSQGFTFKPGKWSVDAFIEVPPTATAGVYSLQWRFDSKGLHLEEKNYFVVKRP